MGNSPLVVRWLSRSLLGASHCDVSIVMSHAYPHFHIWLQYRFMKITSVFAGTISHFYIVEFVHFLGWLAHSSTPYSVKEKNLISRGCEYREGEACHAVMGVYK